LNVERDAWPSRTSWLDSPTISSATPAPQGRPLRTRVLDQGPQPVQGFATFLQNDWDAVANGLTLPWSSGAVEGQVTRIKLIKRRSYGRASFGLLRTFVLAQPP
jgi:hypothetical protein